MQMNPTVPRPRFLLVEDDIISSGFFKAALETLPARVDTAENMAAALSRAQADHYDLWLIDVNLPDGRGSELLQKLRQARPETPALAHTADAASSLHEQLRADGFIDTLIKPLGREDLLKAVRRALVQQPIPRHDGQQGSAVTTSAPGDAEDWDEVTALAALNGQRNHLIALRELFLAELPSVRDAVEQAVDREDETALRGQLHRLQASCGFVGAARLARAVRYLRQTPASPEARVGFSTAVAALLH